MSIDTPVRALGFVTGCLIAAGFVLSGHIASSSTPLGSDLTLRTGSTAELIVKPQGRILSARDLTRGHSESGRLSARNPTDVTLAVSPRLRAPVRVPSGLEARVDASGRTIFEGPLSRLTERGGGAFEIPSGGRATLALSIRATGPATSLAGTTELALRLDLVTRVAR